MYLVTRIHNDSLILETFFCDGIHLTVGYLHPEHSRLTWLGPLHRHGRVSPGERQREPARQDGQDRKKQGKKRPSSRQTTVAGDMFGVVMLAPTAVGRACVQQCSTRISDQERQHGLRNSRKVNVQLF